MRDKFGDLWLGFEPDELCAWARQTGFINPEVSFADTEREVFMLTVSK